MKSSEAELTKTFILPKHIPPTKGKEIEIIIVSYTIKFREYKHI